MTADAPGSVPVDELKCPVQVVDSTANTQMKETSMYQAKRAIIMAAGKGERMHPLTE